MSDQSESVPQIARDWTALQRSSIESQAYEKYFWAQVALEGMIKRDPENAWQVVETVLSMEDCDEMLLANLAAGPVEDLLVLHGGAIIECVEARAKQDIKFKKMLGMVWKNAMPDSIWTRVNRAAASSD